MILSNHSSSQVFKAKHKAATAKVQIIPGQGQIELNGQSYTNKFHSNPLALSILFKPLLLAGMVNKLEPYNLSTNLGFDSEKDQILNGPYDIKVTVFGGGLVGQATAIQRALAHAIADFDSSKKALLKSEGQLSKKVCCKERKKYGLKKARKAPQFSKR